ncbi:protein phosphatase 1 regulatory subunit INH3-like [Miscanthus floridulus]|uniref:protein phosphatase 1 regulatory subunit INH3-like n=1 Tax=Miscanthus floridulus TaxID=154761 RepID=UPI003459BC26
MATRAPPQSSSTGSVTVTIDPSPSSSSSTAPPPAAASAPAPAPESVVLRLKRWAKKKVSWKEGTVDNEGLGRKSSKKCCIFHKEVPFDEDCSDDEAPGGGGHRCPRPHGDAGEGTSGGGGGECPSSSHDHGHGHGHH